MPEVVWHPSLENKDVETKEVNLVYDGEFKVKNIQLRHRNFDGEWTGWIWREQISRRNAAAVLLWDIEKDVVVLVEQLRIGLVNGTQSSPWLLEIVAGLIDEGETPEQTAMRESQEEAGCEIKQLIKIGEFFNSPGGFVEATHVYLGIVQANHAGGIFGLSEEHENIKVHHVPFNDLMEALNNQQWTSSASTVIALQWLKNNKSNLNIE